MKPGHWSVAAFAGSAYAWTLFVWSRLGAPQSFAAWRHVSSEDAAFIGYPKNTPAPANYMNWRRQTHLRQLAPVFVGK